MTSKDQGVALERESPALRAKVRIPPDDRHNQLLVDRVHPPDWENPTPPGRYDLVVLGGGSGGLVSAAIAAGVGGRVALVERHLLGGDCLNTGCVPSKALIRAGRAWAEARRGAERFGAPAVSGDGDFATVMERMRRIRAEIGQHDAAERFRNLGIDVYLGDGRFIGEDRLEVGGQVMEFRRAVVATGGRPAVPPVQGLEESGYLTSETVFGLTERPEELVVLGGGPIGCELAQAMAQLGSTVTLLEMQDRILPQDDPDAAEIVARALAADGVDVRPGTRVVSVDAQGGKHGVRVHRESPAGEEADATETLTSDRILVAAGRAPNVEGLGLEDAGVAFDSTGVRVDERLRTTNKRIFAVGDVTGKAQFTHLADAHARLAVPNALFFGRGKTGGLVVPRATYTSPEVAHVGLAPHATPDGPDKVDTITIPFEDVDRARLDGDSEGFLRVHLKRGTDRIEGATVVGAHAGELLAPLVVAMRGRVGLGALSGAIFPYPTVGEAVRKAGDQWRRRKLTPRVKSIMARLLRLLR